jgi:hypothetical protein
MDVLDHIVEELDNEFTGSLESYSQYHSALIGSEYDETGNPQDPNYHWLKKGHDY